MAGPRRKRDEALDVSTLSGRRRAGWRCRHLRGVADRAQPDDLFAGPDPDPRCPGAAAVRDFIAVYPSILDSDTWAELKTSEHRLAWVIAMLLGAQQTPDGTFDSRKKLERLLDKEGIHDATLSVEALEYSSAIEIGEDGVVSIRGWSRWQRQYRGVSDLPALKAANERARYWEEKARKAAETSPVTNLRQPVTSLEPSGIEELEESEEREEGINAREDLSDLSVESDLLDRFHELTLLRPWGRSSGRWLRDIEANYGLGPSVEAMDAEHKANPEPNTLISRTEARLAKAADRRKQSQVKEAKAPRKADPEIEARQRAVMTEMIAGGGGTG